MVTVVEGGRPMKVLASLTAYLVAVASAAFPQASPAERLTLTQAIAEALEKAPVLAAAAAQERAARLKAKSASRTRLGQAEAFGRVSRFQDDQMIRPMSLQLFQSVPPSGSPFDSLPWDRDQGRYGVTYQVPIFASGRLSSAIDLASLAASQAALLVSGTRWEIRANVAALYAGAQTLDAVAAAVAEQQAALEATRRRVQLMVELGKRPRLELLEIDEELQSTIARRSSVAADAARLRALLLALVGRDPQTPLTIDALTEEQPRLAVDETQLRALALESSPVRRADIAVQQADAGVAAARAALLPSVLARGTWMQSWGLDTREHASTWELSAGVVVPLFTGGARRAALASARESGRAAASAREKARLDRLAQLAETLARFAAVREGLTASVARVEAAVEAARIQQLRYNTGAGTVEDLLRAKAREMAAVAARAQARGDLVAAAERLNAVCEQEVVQ
jgi:outer membrane protein TolC